MLQAPRKPPLTVRLIRLYPRSWYDRYGEELVELLSAEPATPVAIAHVLAGALDAHLHRDLVGDATRSPATMLRMAMIAAFCAFVAFVVVALTFYEAVTDLSFAPLMRTHPDLAGTWSVLEVGAAVTLVAVLAGGLPIFLTVVKDAWAHHRRDLRLCAVPPLALLVLWGCDLVEEVRRTAHLALPRAVGLLLDVGFHLLFVVAAGACTSAVCVLVLRSTIAPRLFRFALGPATLATVAMTVTVGGTVAWLARASAAAPNRLGLSLVGIGFALLVALMALSMGLAARAVLQGFAAQTPQRSIV